MKMHTLQAMLDAQERRLLKIVTIDGANVQTPDDFMIETHAGEILVPNTHSLCIRVIAVPVGKFLKPHETEPDELAYEREVRATGVYEVELGDYTSLLVPAISIREKIAILTDAPDERTFTRSDIIEKAQHRAAPAEGEGLAAPPPSAPNSDAEALALIEAGRKALAAPVAQDAGFAEPVKKPFNPRTWMTNEIAAWRATG